MLTLLSWRSDRPLQLYRLDCCPPKTPAFVIASFFAGLAGALLAHYPGTINPNQFDVEAMVYVLVWVIVGETATIYGPFLGVVTLTVVNEIVLRELGVDQARPLIFGTILIPSILFLPDGLANLGPKLKLVFARTRERAGA